MSEKRNFVQALSEEQRLEKLRELWPELEPIINGLKRLLARLCDEGDHYGVLGCYEAIGNMLEAATQLAGITLIPVDEVIEEERIDASVH